MSRDIARRDFIDALDDYAEAAQLKLDFETLRKMEERLNEAEAACRKHGIDTNAILLEWTQQDAEDVDELYRKIYKMKGRYNDR